MDRDYEDVEALSPCSASTVFSMNPYSIGTSESSQLRSTTHLRGRVPGMMGSADFQSPTNIDLEYAQYVYGTNLDYVVLARQLRVFFENFRISRDEPPFYIDRMKEAYSMSEFEVKVDAMHFVEYEDDGGGLENQSIYRHLINFPMEVVPCIDQVVYQIMANMFIDAPANRYQVQIHNLHKSDCRSLRDLSPNDIEKLVSISGVVNRCSELQPDLVSATFRCMTENCEVMKEVALKQGGDIEEPLVCTSCGAKESFQMDYKYCVFSDKQQVKLQEPPEAINEGETPQTVMFYAYDNLYDVARPGDRISVVGIYRIHRCRVNLKTRQLHTVFRYYIDAIHIERQSGARLIAAEEEGEKDSESEDEEHREEARLNTVGVSEDLRDRFQALARNRSGAELRKMLVDAFAPSIFEYEDVKLGLLCQIFGAVARNSQLGGGKTKRLKGEISVLMCGDPSTAKSQFLQYVHKIAPRGVYTSGKGSSAVGLTAYVTKDPDTRELVLESGALVLSDRGVCCIDEFDKMDETTRAILHEAMEQQTVSIAKAGVICTLNARTAICACANPIGSRYDSRKSVVENINLTPTLLTRFDLIYLMLDKQHEPSDRRLAKHIVSMFRPQPQNSRPVLTAEELTAYIAYARMTSRPELTQESAALLKKEYLALRRSGMSRKTVSATPRQLESLIRISEALARMELASKVEIDHVQEAVRLIKAATYSAATDPLTGQIDMSILITGMAESSRNRRQHLVERIEQILSNEIGRQMKMEPLITILAEEELHNESHRFEERDFFEAIASMEVSGVIMRKGKGSALQRIVQLISSSADF